MSEPRTEAGRRLLATISEYDDFFGAVFDIEDEAARLDVDALTRALVTHWLNTPWGRHHCDEDCVPTIAAAALTAEEAQPADPEPIVNETESGYARRRELVEQARKARAALEAATAPDAERNILEEDPPDAESAIDRRARLRHD